MTAHGPERRGPECPGPDHPAEWDREPEEVVMDEAWHELPGQPTPHVCQSCGHPINCECAARPSADTETLRARIVAARGTHDCPVCNAGRPIPDDVTCPLCDGWTTL